ncbi:porphyromonas-type peptidyl-arginine deiminase [Phytomonospora endophytica]|nr:porphyromonas-type peptidyl-arginine deiminase [Phytomonospora endophytica]
MSTALLSGTAAALAACESGDRSPVVVDADASAWRMPDETHEHELTYMSWPTRRIWESDVDDVRADIAGIARAIAEFEPVVLLAGERDVAAAAKACGSGVDVLPATVDDLWARDTAPNFVLGPDGVAGIDLNFNGWGGKQFHDNDARVARTILDEAGIARIQAPIVGEGGSIEVDGAGTLMATESSLVNANRNPGKTRDDIEAALKDLYGVTTVIWVDGVAGHDITDFHIDALARFARPGVVVMSTPDEQTPPDVWTAAYDQAHGVLTEAVDAQGRRLDIVALPEPVDIGRRGEDFLASYVNYYVVNGGVIAPRFGDKRADADAAAILAELYPGREIVQVGVDTLGEGGGGVHCSTQQLPVG